MSRRAKPFVRSKSLSVPTARKLDRLTEQIAIEIWVLRWLRVKRTEIRKRYDCDPRRLYDIWEEIAFRGSREKARALFEERYPQQVAATDFSRHRRFAKPGPADNQLSLFD